MDKITIKEAVYQAVGHASVCWVDGFIPTGIFDEAEASRVAEKLLEQIEEYKNG